MYFGNQQQASDPRRMNRGQGAQQAQFQQANANPFQNFMGQGSDFFQGFQNFPQHLGAQFGQPGMAQQAGMNFQGQAASVGMPRQEHMGNGARRHAHSSSDNLVDISNHSVSLTLTEPSDSVYLRGHNCKIEIGSGNTISNLYISGHNNKVYARKAQSEDGVSLGVVGNINVSGHNNRIDSLISSCVKVNGHNNRFAGLIYAVKEDFGICNTFQDCVQNRRANQALTQQHQQQEQQQHMHQQRQQRQERAAQQYMQQQQQMRMNQNVNNVGGPNQPQDLQELMQPSTGFMQQDGQEIQLQGSSVNIANEFDDEGHEEEEDDDEEDYLEQQDADDDEEDSEDDQFDSIAGQSQQEWQARRNNLQQVHLRQRQQDAVPLSSEGSGFEQEEAQEVRRNRINRERVGPQMTSQDGLGGARNELERLVDEARQVEIEDASDDQDELDDLEDNDQEDEIEDLSGHYDFMNEQLARQQAAQQMDQRRVAAMQQRQRQQLLAQQQQAEEQKRGQRQRQQQQRSSGNGNMRSRQAADQAAFQRSQQQLGGGMPSHSSQQQLPQQQQNLGQLLNSIPGLANIGNITQMAQQISPQQILQQQQQQQARRQQQQAAQQMGGNFGMQGGVDPSQAQQPQGMFDLSNIINDVLSNINHLQTNPGIQMSINGQQFYQQPNMQQRPNNMGGFQFQSQQSSNNMNGQGMFFQNGMQQQMYQDAMNQQMMHGQGVPQGQQFADYDNEYDDDEDAVDEDGEPIPSPEEVRQIINAINSFKYEEKKPAEDSNGKTASSDSHKESCAICLDDVQTGQMVKALQCSHKFHEKCINNWLRQKLQCPLCKEKVKLNV